MTTKNASAFYLPFIAALLTMNVGFATADQRWSDGGRYDLDLTNAGLAILTVHPSDLRSWNEVYPLSRTAVVETYPEFSAAHLKNILSPSCQVTLRKTVKRDGGGYVMIEFIGRFQSELILPCSFGPNAEERFQNMKVEVLHAEQTSFERLDDNTLNMKRIWIESWETPHRFAMKDLEQPDFITKRLKVSEMIPPYERYFETTLIRQPHLQPEGHSEKGLW